MICSFGSCTLSDGEDRLTTKLLVSDSRSKNSVVPESATVSMMVLCRERVGIKLFDKLDFVRLQ